MTLYKHRLLVVTHKARQTKANMAAADWDPDTGGAKTFENLTHCYSGPEYPEKYPVCSVANTAATDEMRSKIEAALKRGELDSVVDITEKDPQKEIARLGLEAVSVRPAEPRPSLLDRILGRTG